MPSCRTLGALAALLSFAAPASLPAQSTSVADTTTVTRFRQAVLRASPEFAARRAELAAAKAAARGAGAAPPLVLAAEVEEVPDGIDLGNAGALRLEVGREWITGGRGPARRDLARVETEEAAARLALAEQRIGARMDRLLVAALGNGAIAARLAAEDTLLGEAEGALRARFASGEARYVDVLRLRTERLRVRTDLAVALTDERVHRRALLALIGSGDSARTLRALADSVLATAPSTVLDHLPSSPPQVDSLVARSAAARLAEAGAARAEATRRLRRAEAAPSLTTGLGVQRFGAEEGGFQVGPTVSLAVSLPFTAPGAARATRESADRSAEAARLESVADLASLRAALESARDRYEGARERLAVFDAALLQGAQEERESAVAAYRAGELSLLELLDFERALSRTEISRIRSRVEAAEAYAELMSGDSGDRETD